jgi:hypothetical protein
MTDQPFWRQPLPPIARPAPAGALAAAEPQDTSTATELPPGAAAKGGGAVTSGASAPPLETRLAPHDVLRNAVHDLDLARWNARQCRDAVAASREAFNVALKNWNATGDAPQTQAELMKAHVASNQRERERKAAAGQLRTPTTISQIAKAIGIGGHRAQRGGGVSYRRGAHSKAEALELNARRIAATNAAHTRVKLPSER